MRRLNQVAWIAAVMIAQSAVPAPAAESLPMPLARYADLCKQSGGSVAQQLTSGVGVVQCTWPGQGRTDCDVGANLVNVCGISCQSNACLKDHPARHSPVWPLQGGPSGG